MDHFSTPIPPRRSRPLLAIGICLLATLIAASSLLPVSAPLAAATDAPPDNTSPTTPVDSTNFGGATPSEKFVQSFQQQVSSQLQSALEQSNAVQEERLHAYEQQQRVLSDHLQELEQAINTNHGTAVSNVAAPLTSVDVEPPRVNAHRVATPDTNRDDISVAANTFPIPSSLEPTSSDKWDLLSSSTSRSENSAAWSPGERSLDQHALKASANIAPHGFIEGRLLNGVVAINGGPDRESIVALSGNYHSANDYVVDLDGCFALVQGKPEIAAGRIDFKLSRLTCNFPDGASRTWDTAGWLVDSDGIRGVRATIVDNTSRKAAVAAAGGAVGGLGQRLSQQQYESSSALGGLASSTTFTGSPARDALGGAATGAANSIGQSISDYYNLYSPSLQVGGGTPVTVVLANDLKLPASGHGLSQTHVATP